jgi:hypothetical protein
MYLALSFSCSSHSKPRSPHTTTPSPQAKIYSTAATTPRPLARHVFDGLYGQDPVVGSDGFDGLNGEGDSDYFDY